MRVAVTGAGGLLGATLVPLWRRAGADMVPWRRGDLDVTDGAAVRRMVEKVRPDVVIHLAAYTDVDGAEAEPEAAMRVNGEGTAHVCRAGEAAGARVVYVSTDYVFDGRARAPISSETPPSPVGAYARSKAEGERVVRAAACDWLIVRTGWAFGPGGPNFVDTMRALATAGRPVRVVRDQWGAPTSTRIIAETLWALLGAGAKGTWHVAAAGEASWFEVARLTYRAAGAAEDLVAPCLSSERRDPASRPAYAVLDTSRTVAALGAAMPAWDEQVSAYVLTGALPGAGFIRGAMT